MEIEAIEEIDDFLTIEEETIIEEAITIKEEDLLIEEIKFNLFVLESKVPIINFASKLPSFYN